MPWTPLAERFANLPLILAGPMLRRTEPRAVTVWLALKEPRMVTLRIYARDAGGGLVQQLEGTRHTVRLGDHLHIVAVTARATSGDEQLAWGGLYYYDLFFQSDSTTEGLMAVGQLNTPGILNSDPSLADPLHRLVYPGHPLPGFVLPPEDLNHVSLLHGSCRKPQGVGKEMLSALDTILEAAARDAANRPQQLFMTGDQIYADDVAASLLFALIDAGKFLLQGNQEEVLPLVNALAGTLAPGGRSATVRNRAMLTTTSPENHLLAWSEYATMYLFAWSDVLWPDEMPGAGDIWKVYPGAQPEDAQQKKVQGKYEDERERLHEFCATLPQVRRALANIATYTICDDHDVTDDWFLDGAWCKRVLASPLGKRVVRNALLAYCLFQAWGNTPDQFEEANGTALLDAINGWRGDESDPRAATIAEITGLPASFDEGSGELPRSERALHWYYTIPGPHHHTIVMDTRTQRLYRSPKEFPGLLSPGAMQRQIIEAARKDAEVTVIISAAPVLGVGFLEAIQFWSRLRFRDNYAFDREAWNLEWGTFQTFLSKVSAMKRVVFLSGDVHYAFGASLEYWDHHTKATAKIVDYTSSPLRNEGSSTKMAVLAAGYPQLYHLLGRVDMPAVDFFAWDMVPGKRHIAKRMLGIIWSRAYEFWWSIPRFIDALRSPYEIVLPARGWPKGAFNLLPPDRSYRLQYLRDTHTKPRDLHPVAKPSLRARLSRLKSRSIGVALAGVTLVQSTIWRTMRRLVRRAQAPGQVPRGARHIVRGAIRGSELLDRRLEKRKNMLAEVILHREEWLSKWKAGAHIVGYANIGEICFRWTAEEKEVFQRLWWWRPDDTECPTVATEYQETLDLPEAGEAPELP